jgi:RNA polymerase sigma-70 factor, ECF subfamily
MTVSEDFTSQTRPYRGELLAHCYRMLGCAQEAEDLVQETCLRAWRAYAGFAGRSSVRTWLYRIATNVCLTALERRARRPVPSALDTDAAGALAPDVPWLRPMPDRPLAGPGDDPAAVAARIVAFPDPELFAGFGLPAAFAPQEPPVLAEATWPR